MKYENMMDINRLKERKKALGYTNEEVARLSGVPLGTVQKAFGNVTGQPRRKTMIALAKVLDPDMANMLQSGEVSSSGNIPDVSGEMPAVKEAQAAYSAVSTETVTRKKKQGEYTLEDYYAIPDDRRVELINGTIYDMTAPSSYHQLVAGEVHHQLVLCRGSHDIDCMPFISPIDVQLDKDERTMVEPDVIIVCDKDMITRRCIYGAPDFVLEVLSPSTRSKDQILKLKKYMEAGCKEYWIVDIENRKVTVFVFEEENWPKTYSFTDNIPVAISKGYCKIDFSKVDDLLNEFGAYEEE